VWEGHDEPEAEKPVSNDAYGLVIAPSPAQDSWVFCQERAPHYRRRTASVRHL